MMSAPEIKLKEMELRISEISTLGFILDRSAPRMEEDIKSLRRKVIKRLDTLIDQNNHQHAEV